MDFYFGSINSDVNGFIGIVMAGLQPAVALPASFISGLAVRSLEGWE